MNLQPLNKDGEFTTWTHFDTAAWIDFNPSCVDLPSGRMLGVIRRDAVPPVPGHGSLWTVPLDDELMPVGQPTRLVARGEDPRVVRIGNRLYVFYAVIERDAEDRVCGSAMRLLECEMQGDKVVPMHHLELPKNPLGKAIDPNGRAGWEKNWVPFVVSPTEIALIYSHDPWEVLVLDVAPDGDQRRFKSAYRGPALSWCHGHVRGGTPPLPYSDDLLITFFHSSEVVGSRKLYMVGACTFDREPPFTLRSFTREPLLVAPYRSGAHRFGWNFAGSVVFPLGAQTRAQGFRLLCGLDDGVIGYFDVAAQELARRLQPTVIDTLTVHNVHGQSVQGRGEPLTLDPFDASSLHAARMLSLLCDHGGMFVDAAPGDGVAMLRLAYQFDRTLAFEPAVPARRRLARLLALNGLDAVEIDGRTLCGSEPTTLSLDALPLQDLRLLRIDHPTLAAAVLLGAGLTLRRHRPVVLLQMPADGLAAARVSALLQASNYSVEALFPFTPSRRLCLPLERRAEYGWLV